MHVGVYVCMKVYRHIGMCVFVYPCITNPLFCCLAISKYIHVYIDESSAPSVRACGARRGRPLV